MDSAAHLTDSEESSMDICRVCRMEGSSDRPLYYPCICTGSIKYIHQECLTQWLKYSKKEYCELCNHKYTFMPIYHPDMPKRLPIHDLTLGLMKNLMKAVRFWLHYTFVAAAWLGIVPLTACRIYRCLFTGSVNSLLTLPLDMLSTENLMLDCLQGGFILAVTLCTFISLIWLREQIMLGGLPEWIDNGGGQVPADHQPVNHPVVANVNIDDAELNGQPGDNLVEEGLPGDPGPAEPQPEVQPADNDAAQDENNWQPFEWNQAADELTWERLLGLDGSLIFVEHVFWVISLNTLFILVFAFSPYHIGHFAVVGFKLLPYIRATHFEGLSTTLFGYLIVATVLFLLHRGSQLVKFARSAKLTGMCYLVVKVFLLVLMEIGVFPLLCGTWLDICSLNLFNSTLSDRIDNYYVSPGTSLFIHWLVGMVYVFYFASFILMLREVLRPGVLWFLRTTTFLLSNLNDPDFNPINEMITFPVYRHIRRFGASLVMFGATIILIVFLPIKVIEKTVSFVVPYNISLSVEAPLSELTLELLLLQVVLPALLEQGHARQAMKLVARRWCLAVGNTLGLTEYLLRAEDIQQRDNNHNVLNPQPDANGNVIPGAPPLVDLQNPQDVAAVAVPHGGGHLAAEHQAMVLGMGPVGEEPFNRPQFFPLRVVLLIFALSVSFFVASLICLTVPVTIGREVVSLVIGKAPVHELYTMACGLYLSWVVLRSWVALVEWLPHGWDAALNSLRHWATVVNSLVNYGCDTLGKCLAVSLAVAGLLPLMLGFLFQLVIITPLRVPVNQSPVYFPWQDWAMGILHCKIICAVVMMGPDWWMKTVFERVYEDGIRNMNVTYIYVNLVLPVVSWVGLLIAIPYALAHTTVPMMGGDLEAEIVFQRHIYPCLLIFTLVFSFVCWQIQQFRRLVQHIRNDKYLVGQRLVNYDRQRKAELEAAELQLQQQQLEQPEVEEVLNEPVEVE